MTKFPQNFFKKIPSEFYINFLININQIVQIFKIFIKLIEDR